MKLFEECPRCTLANRKLKECEEALRVMDCLPRDFKASRVDCSTCSMRGHILTDEGRKLVELLRPFFVNSPLEPEIPF